MRVTKPKNMFSVKTMSFCAVSAAVMCILGPMSIPIGTIPVSFTNLVIYASLFVTGKRRTTLSVVIYLLLGIFGLPVFSGYSGGFGKLMGPTGGYLIGFVFLAFIGGTFIEKSKGSKVISFVGLVLGTAAAYLFGTAWFVVSMGCTWVYAFAVCVMPFIAIDIIKIILALIAGPAVRKRLDSANVDK